MVTWFFILTGTLFVIFNLKDQRTLHVIFFFNKRKRIYIKLILQVVASGHTYFSLAGT